MHRRSVLLAALGLLGAASPTLAAKKKAATPKARPVVVADPSAIVTTIYKAAAGPGGKYQGESVFDSAMMRSHFSASLLAAVNKMEAKSKKTDEPILDFDPVLNTQEAPSVKQLDISVESAAPTVTIVAARFFSFDDKDPNIIRYDFIMENNVWKIDNMRGEHGADAPWSLRDIIEKG